MWRPRDHLHAQFGTLTHLFAEGRFESLIDQAEAFNQGSPFTVCQCPALGKGDINLTAAVRQKLSGGLWVPEAGKARLTCTSPANGRGFSIELHMPVQEGRLAEVHFRLETRFLQPDELEDTVAFLTSIAIALDPEYGYAHDAFDEAIQDTTDVKRYRTLTGSEPKTDPIDERQNPGRSTYADGRLVTVRWLSLYGGTTLAAIGRERALDAPCQTEPLANGNVLLRLYDDPLAHALPEFRARHLQVRQYLRIDDLVESSRWEAVERRPSGDFDRIPTTRTRAVALTDKPIQQAVANRPPIPVWAGLYDATIAGRPEEIEFYRTQARRAAGRVLELGCGTGRIMIPVAKTGVPVTSVESSAEAIEHVAGLLAAQPTALKDRTTLLERAVDDPELAALGPFAAVFIPYRGVNRYTDPETLRELLEALRGSLQQGGVLAFNTFFPRLKQWSLGSKPTPVLVYRGECPDGEGEFLIWDTLEVDIVSQHMHILRHLEQLDERGRIVDHQYLVLHRRYYFPDELRYLLELSGFEARIFGGFEGEELVAAAQEMVVVGRRP